MSTVGFASSSALSSFHAAMEITTPPATRSTGIEMPKKLNT
jgi:hypothetical protein